LKQLNLFGLSNFSVFAVLGALGALVVKIAFIFDFVTDS
jgi:hypothetical protein